jgi:hypothetical protein
MRAPRATCLALLLTMLAVVAPGCCHASALVACRHRHGCPHCRARHAACANAEDDASVIEEPGPDFPRFHPVPTQPAFSPRDGNGFPITSSGVALPTDASSPNAAPPEEGESIATPQPLANAGSAGEARGRPRNYRASWVFTRPRVKPAGLPPRNPRPIFKEPEQPTQPARPSR